MENKLGFFEKLISFGKPQLAPQLVAGGVKKALGYFVLLCLLIALFNGAVNVVVMYPMGVLNDLRADVSEILPDFELKEGKLHLETDQPYICEKYKTVFVFENGEGKTLYEQYASTLDENTLQLYYINSTEIVIKDKLEERIIPVSNIPFSIDKAGVLAFISNWAWVLVAMMTLFMFIAVLISGVVFSAITALVSMVLKSIMKVEISFANLFALSFYAITPVLLVEALMSAFSALTGNSLGGLDFLISLAAAIGIMYMYLNVINQDTVLESGQDVYYNPDKEEQVIEGEFTDSEQPSDDDKQ